MKPSFWSCIILRDSSGADSYCSFPIEKALSSRYWCISQKDQSPGSAISYLIWPPDGFPNKGLKENRDTKPSSDKARFHLNPTRFGIVEIQQRHVILMIKIIPTYTKTSVEKPRLEHSGTRSNITLFYNVITGH